MRVPHCKAWAQPHIHQVTENGEWCTVSMQYVKKEPEQK